MELIVVLLGGVVLAIPVIAIVALVRTEKLREDVDQHHLDQQDKIRDLEARVSGLRRDLAQVSERLGKTVAPVAASPAPEVKEKLPASEPARVWAPPVQVAPEAAHPVAVAPPPIAAPTAASVKAAPSPAPFLKPVEPKSSGSAGQSAPTAPRAIPATPVPSIPVRPAVIPPAQHTTPAPTPPMASANPSFGYAPAPQQNVQPSKSIAEHLRSALPLEEVLGMTLFAKIGIVLLVLGFALLGRVALISMGPGPRVAMIYAVAGVMLGGGIWLERNERYRLVGRTGIGGGWALLFFTTYAMNHVGAMAIISSNTLDCVLMLAVAIAMVTHTLRYQSQLVTGLAFLLAFSTVALSQDSVYALVAGVILVFGIVAITLRMSWYELEVFGMLASYANHFYWLYKLYPDGMAGQAFPQFWPSAIILVLYWFIFRLSYIVRRIRTARNESVSTVAALTNTMLLLGVLKFQSTRPELAFFALLGLGAVEFFFGQLPITRRRRPAFVLLTVMGTILVFAAAPFRFSGNNIALFWMIAAEVLLIAGLTQLEVVFRRLGWLGGVITGLLILYEARDIVAFRQTSQAAMIHSGVLLLACSALFYLNALYFRSRWNERFDELDRRFALVQGYLGAVTAFLGIWAVFSADWTAVGWAALMLAAACGKRFLNDKHLLVQAGGLSAAVLLQAFTYNCHFSDPYPHHVVARLITLPILALAFYGMAWVLSFGDDLRGALRKLSLWAGSVLLVSLVWLDVKQVWVAAVWVVFAVALSLIGRRLKIADLNYQEHLLAVAATAQMVAVNLDAQHAVERYIPLLGCACGFYAISRFCTLKEAVYRQPAAWVHTWAATALLAALAWHESPQPWLAVIWAIFALALAVADRLFEIEELPYQTHMLALLAVVRAVTLNMYTVEKWHQIDLRLITVSILVAVLYALARWVRLPASLHNTEARHLYTWAASALAAWMLWSELQPIGVALGLAVFGLLLFEWGEWRQIEQIRLQAYVALTAAFVRIFFVNLTATTMPGETISPRIYTVVPLAMAYFFVWAQLQSRKVQPGAAGRMITNLIAYFGAGCVTALLYFEVPAEWIIFAWGLMVLALMASSLLLKQEVFLHQAELLVAGIAGRGIAHNIYGGSYFVAGGWRGNIAVLSLTAALLLALLPIALRLRERYRESPNNSRLIRYLALRRPEQILFFAPVTLVSFMIAVKMNAGMVTLSWGVEGVLMILLGLLATQRSYRITGLFLLLLCVAKIVFRDAWNLDERDRYITFIVLGAALTLVSTLYSKYRETIRRLL
jgi:hypothetical protein